MNENNIREMICPSCGCGQSPSPVCSSCGVNIKEYLADLRREILAREDGKADFGTVFGEKPTEPRPAAEKKDGENAEEGRIICPNCGMVQAETSECAACGVVIGKYIECLKSSVSLDDGNPDRYPSENELDAAAGSKKHGDSKPADRKTGPFQVFFRKRLGRFRQVMVFFVITWLLYGLMLYGAKVLWYIYLETHIGKTYFLYFRDRAQAIVDLFNQNQFVFSFRITLTVTATCLVFGALCQLLFLTRYFFYGRNLAVRILLWGPVNCVLSVICLELFLNFGHQGAIALGILPTLCMYAICFRFTSELLPEMDLPRAFRYVKNRFAPDGPE